MNKLYSFFNFYGGKQRAAKIYPIPQYNTIIEPFAGSAGYSVNYWWKNIILYDIDPKICSVWDYLIKVTPEEILNLPENFQHINEINVCQEVKYFIGFWINGGTSQPCKKPSKWMKSGLRPSCFWGKRVKERMSEQVNNIKHWKIYNQSYQYIDNTKCTWFIDPPYNNKAGKRYKYNKINYNDLSQWCRERNGQTIVCEQVGANWLPFEFLSKTQTIVNSKRIKKSAEAIWTNCNE